MNLPEILQSLQRYHSDREIIQMTADQLIKDMGEFSIQITFKGKKETPYKELYDQVEPVIQKLERKEPERLRALLYRIDISEKKIIAALSDSSEIDLSAFITDLILQRELQKVLTRIYFSHPDRLK
jgi:hypothetical protein